MDNIKIVVFDIGGTLMEYKNMPNVWVDFYQTAFNHVRKDLNLKITDYDLNLSVERLKQYNPRINYREIDYKPEKIFNDITSHWNCDFSVDDVIKSFFSSLNLTSYIYTETISVLERLKAENYIIAALTDVATGMPDELHKSYFSQLMPYFDMYVSSISCGYRKPNPKGLNDIAVKFGADEKSIIFVGDEEKDILTAKRFGCKSVLMDRKNLNYCFGQDYTIDNLNQLFVL